MSVPERAQRDQAAGKLWSALGNNLSQKLGCSTSNVSEILVDRTNLSNDQLRWFLSYFLNYDVEALEMNQIHYRYPHYNEKAIQQDMDHFIHLGLAEQGTEGWTLNGQGATIINDYWALKMEEARSCEESPAHLTIFTTLVRKIIDSYSLMEELPSLRLRVSNRPSGFEAFPALLQAFVFQQELSAVFNDIGHHRFEILSSAGGEEWTKWELSPLAQELMGATRNQRVYAIERCHNQSSWRVGSQICDDAVQELLNLGLIEIRSDSINQTPLGRQYFQAADALAEKRIYRAWNCLNQKEYESFKKSLEWLNN